MKFSQFYFPPQEYVADNKKMRIRIGSYLFSLSFRSKTTDNFSLAKQVTQSVGITIPGYHAANKSYVYNFEQLCNEISVIELLDIISIIYATLTDWTEKRDLIKFVNECFVEEGLAYVMNQQGEIRFRPDEEFERNKALTLKSLTGSHFTAVLEAFNHAYNEFQTDLTKGKSAFRYIFEANEILFKKLAKPKHDFDQLNSSSIEKIKNHIADDVIDYLDATAKQATLRFLESYKKWVDAMHPYRHGQDVETYNNPPVDLTIFALSSGASYLRWLASIMQIKSEKSSKKPS